MRLVIPSAGIGSRLNEKTKNRNKALVSVGGLPAIVKIIDYYLKCFDIEKVIVLTGYKGEILKDVLKAFYPDDLIQCIEIKNFDGPGSGLGLTLKEAEAYLQCPFIFSTNDTLLTLDDTDIQSEKDFAVYKKVETSSVDVQQFRTLEIQNKTVTKINPKGANSSNVYLGVCYIKNFQQFWKGMLNDASVSAGEVIGLQALDNVCAVHAKEWLDLGQIHSLEFAQKIYALKGVEILDKDDEAIWFHNNTIIKHHIDPDFIIDRQKRLEFLPQEMMPELISAGKYYYKYQRLPGQTITKHCTRDSFQNLLEILHKNLWSKKCNDDDKIVNLKNLATNFYKDKTIQRVKDYLRVSEYYDRTETINGANCPPILELLHSIDWQTLVDNCQFANFHGDLHNENIIFQDDEYYLLDWRQNFGGNEYEFGDVYYDLAKLKHGLMVNHAIINNEDFLVRHLCNSSVIVEVLQSSRLIEIDEVLKKFASAHGYNCSFVSLITALIYLNIAVLHESSYGEFLFYYGRLMLTDALNDINLTVGT